MATSVYYNKYHILWCQALGAPAPLITWFKDGKVLQNDTSSVTYTAWNAKGEYECMANNSFGGTRRKKLVIVRQGKYLIAILKFAAKGTTRLSIELRASKLSKQMSFISR